MKQRRIYITEFDKSRLDDLIERARETGSHNRENLDSLSAELERAKIVEPSKVPASVVTMNSQVLLRDLDSDDTETYSLVFPKDMDIDSGAISVLAPVGTAILGYKEGSTVEWKVPAGKRRLKVEKVLYQPEAAGNFAL